MEHLKRCKTSTWFFFCSFVSVSSGIDDLSILTAISVFISCIEQGVVTGSRVYHQRRHSGFPGDTWPDQPCVPAISNFRQWRPAKPSTGMSFFNFFQAKQLYGFRNLTELHQNKFSFEQGRRKISFAQFLIIKPCLSGLTEVFFARAMHSTSVFLSKCVLHTDIRQGGMNPSGKAFPG